MKIKLDKLAVTQVSVEVPSRCPKCHEKLAEVGVQVHGWMAVSQDATLGRGGFTGWGDDTHDYYESQYQTEVHCRKCDHVIVSTEEEG